MKAYRSLAKILLVLSFLMALLKLLVSGISCKYLVKIEKVKVFHLIH